MARTLDDALLPFDRVTPMGDDEIAVHAEALDDGRDAPEGGLWPTGDLQDDEIASHLEQGEMVFALPRPGSRRRRAVRH